MQVSVGLVQALGWVMWYVRERCVKPSQQRRPYAWKALLFTMCLSLACLLELNDFPPFFGLFDAHAIWHASTIPLCYLNYSFMKDDIAWEENHATTLDKAQ